MSGKNEEKTQAAADRIKAAALSAAKGLSRAQAERAATAAARNVNAYGQKEEGPSRWQERKEAKRQMYLMSTEKAVKLGERKDLKGSISTSGGHSSQCQKCFQPGHWTYECKNERVYMSRPSRTQQLKNPKLKMTLSVSYELDNPDIEGERSEKTQKKDKGKKSGSKSKSKRKHRSRSDSEDSSEASVFETDNESSVTGSDYSSAESISSSSSSDSEERRRRRKKQKKEKKKKGHRRYTSSSDSSESESASDSDSDDKASRRKTKRHSRRR
ncbi:zinc finger CCHC domain-containing protein 10 [Iris pallida]|uniref:Zinc finger CCHC domain-containing protein 10 n=1 Tax=Iris pallida TaxID=29817 RepID=A0AAX6DWL5_IRIPA|nr:zinc finger CCHC domain-containing protein 10 [Iris pallida]